MQGGPMRTKKPQQRWLPWLAGVGIALAAGPAWAYAQDEIGPESADEVPTEVPAQEMTQEDQVVRTRFYWPKYASAQVIVEQVENDQSFRYGMELYVTPAGKDDQGRAIRLTGHELQSLGGIAIAALDEHDTDREITEFKLRLAPARYLDANGAYQGCDNVSDLVQANLSVIAASDQVDPLLRRRLQREMTSSAVARQIKDAVNREMLEWAGYWNDVELAQGQPRTVKRLIPMAQGGQVQVDATLLWQGQVERDGKVYEQIWLRARLKDEVFRKVAANLIRRSGIALPETAQGEQVITASIITDPYTLLPVEVTAQYNTVMQAGEVERAHLLARKATFTWEKGKEVLTHAEGDSHE